MAWLHVQRTLPHDVNHSLAACSLDRDRSIALAAQPGQLPDAKMLALFAMGALVSLRGGGADQGAEVNVLLIQLRGFVMRYLVRTLPCGHGEKWQPPQAFGPHCTCCVCFLLMWPV